MVRKVDISYKTVIFITIFIALLWALYQIREVIVLLFVAIILMSAISPLVDTLVRYKIPKVLAIALIYIVAFVIIGGLISVVVVPLIDQTTNLIQNLPEVLERTLPPGVFDRSTLPRELSNFSSNAVTFTVAIFNNLLAFISVAVLTFYLLLERYRLDDLIGQFFIGKEDRARKVMRGIEDKLGAWLRGQLTLSFIIGGLSYLALMLLGIPYALPLAILAGIFEVVPVIGPIISAIPAVLVALTISPYLAMFVALAFFIIQQLENHLIVPQVMKKAVGLNPLIIILSVSIGGKLLGISGALLAVPIAVVIHTIAEDILKNQS